MINTIKEVNLKKYEEIPNSKTQYIKKSISNEDIINHGSNKIHIFSQDFKNIFSSLWNGRQTIVSGFWAFLSFLFHGCQHQISDHLHFLS